MNQQRLLTVCLSAEQADEVVVACLKRRIDLDNAQQYKLTQDVSADEIADIDRSIDRLRRAEHTLITAIQTELRGRTVRPSPGLFIRPSAGIVKAVPDGANIRDGG